MYESLKTNYNHNRKPSKPSKTHNSQKHQKNFDQVVHDHDAMVQVVHGRPSAFSRW